MVMFLLKHKDDLDARKKFEKIFKAYEKQRLFCDQAILGNSRILTGNVVVLKPFLKMNIGKNDVIRVDPFINIRDYSLRQYTADDIKRGRLPKVPTGFHNVLRVYLEILFSLVTSQRAPGIISEENYLLWNENSGAILVLPSTRSEKKKNFFHLAKILNSLFSVQCSSVDYQAVIKGLELYYDSWHQIRLLSAPYFLSDREIIHDFIPRMWIFAKTNKGFRYWLLKQKVNPEVFEILERGCPELYAVMNHKEGPSGVHELNYFNLLKRLRNVVAHNTDELVEIERQLGRPNINYQSVLSIDSARFVDLIKLADPNFLNELFLRTYHMYGKFDIFDYDLKKIYYDV